MPSPRAHPASSPRTRVRRLPERGRYDRDAIDAVLDAGLVAHLGFVSDGQPFVIPTLHARVGEEVYVHGSSASRTLRELADGIAACLTVTLLDGIVFARSVFEHSMNYRSVVVLGTASPVVERDEKLAALEAFTEKLLPGRWAESRPPTAAELDVWAGHVPFVVTARDPVPDPSLRPGIPVPPALRPYRRPGLVE